MYRNLVTSLLEHERVQTTDAKAKGVRSLAERMITLGKRGDLHARRRALRVIRSREVAAKVFDDLAERYRDRPGGYTRIYKLGRRVGDAAKISIIELVDREGSSKRASTAKEASAATGRSRARKKKSEPEKAKPARKKAAASAEEAPAKAVAKKSPSKKATGKKTAAKKTTAKKTTAKKSAAKKAAAVKTAKKKSKKKK